MAQKNTLLEKETKREQPLKEHWNQKHIATGMSTEVWMFGRTREDKSTTDELAGATVIVRAVNEVKAHRAKWGAGYLKEKDTEASIAWLVPDEHQ